MTTITTNTNSTSPIQNPSGLHKAWIILAILAMVQVIGQAIGMSAGIMVAPLNDADGGFGWNLGLIGAAIAVYFLVGACFSPFAGMLGDRYGARPLMFVCGFMYIGGMLLIGLVSELWHFFLFFGVLLSLTQVLAMVPLQASIGGWFRRRLGLATGILWASGGIGAAALSPVVALLLEEVGWRDTFWSVGIVGGGVLLLLAPFFRSKPADSGLQPYGTREDDPPVIIRTKEIDRLRLRVFSQHMRSTRAFWNLPTIHGLGCAGHGIVLIYSIPLAYEQGISLTAASFILAFISIFSILGRFIAPIFAERIGGKPIMLAALLIQGLTVLILFWAQDPWAFYLFGALFGLGFGGEMSAYLVVNRQYFGSGPLATFYGIEIMGAMMGHAVATVLGGLVIYAIGSFNPAWILSMAFSLAGVIVIMNLEPTARVLIPDWEDSLPPEARGSPSTNKEAATRAALIEAVSGD